MILFYFHLFSCALTRLEINKITGKRKIGERDKERGWRERENDIYFRHQYSIGTESMKCMIALMIAYS
jgi:hypothetical protein